MNKKNAKNTKLDDMLFYYKGSINFMRRCAKPSAKEYRKLVLAHSMGFLMVGFLGYFIKLIHIPINNIIVNN